MPSPALGTLDDLSSTLYDRLGSCRNQKEKFNSTAARTFPAIQDLPSGCIQAVYYTFTVVKGSCVIKRRNVQQNIFCDLQATFGRPMQTPFGARMSLGSTVTHPHL
ncbi:MAG: hypothetical protein QHH10_01635 [Peptococcaceae bacterium]|nr:hypothetical protein [Peptococcaceae bacterium]MDH7523997.1 hypothetical protein [Peptococcaceae bacterium]